jgi:hypothetical protein
LYWLESYLFDYVGPRFIETGKIRPDDFFMIVIWKSNRAKMRIRAKLKGQAGDFAAAVASIAKSLHTSESPREKLRVLMAEWGFRLPMATAILTVLYPRDFSVYDVRVCEQLRNFHGMGHRRFSSELWNDYQAFLAAVDAEVPEELSLRNKDRYLWARSFHDKVLKDIGS